MHISLNVETLGEFLFSKSNHCREVAQLGRVLGLGPRCRRFESCLPDHQATNGLLFLFPLNERIPFFTLFFGIIAL